MESIYRIFLSLVHIFMRIFFPNFLTFFLCWKQILNTNVWESNGELRNQKTFFCMEVWNLFRNTILNFCLKQSLKVSGSSGQNKPSKSLFWRFLLYKFVDLQNSFRVFFLGLENSWQWNVFTQCKKDTHLHIHHEFLSLSLSRTEVRKLN